MRPIPFGLAAAIVVGLFVPQARARTPAQRTLIAQSVGTIVVPVGDTQRRGSCIVVSDKGFVVTSFKLVQGANSANVVFRDGSKHEVTGYVAARKGKDLVILTLRNPKDLPPPVKFATAELKPGDAVEFIGSAAGQPYDFSQGKLLRYISVRQFLAGLEKSSSDTKRLDGDTCWLRSDILQPPQGLGAAMLNQQGELAGMITYVPEWGDRMHTAVHVAHIQDLVAGATASKSLAALKKHTDVDASAPPSAPVRTPVSTPLRGDVTDQFTAWQLTRTDLQEEVESFRKSTADYSGKVEVQTAAIAVLNAKIAKIETEQRKLEREAKDGDKESDRSKARGEIAALDRQLDNLRGEISKQRLIELRWRSWIEQLGIDESAHRRVVSRQWIDLFYLADPWRLRDSGVHRDFEQALTNAIAQKDGYELRLARGVLRHNLREYAAAGEDFQQVAAEKELSKLAQACEARALIADGKEIEGKKLLATVIRGNTDPHVTIVQALVELDQGRFANAERNLLSALERGADPAEIHRLLALLQSAVPEGHPHSARTALESARRACVLTAWQDSEALLALAAAQAEAGEFDQAKDTASRAADLASGEVRERARAWGQAFANRDKLRLTWGRDADR